MATLYVTEYAGILRDRGGGIPVAVGQQGATQTVAISGTHAESNAFQTATRIIRVHTDSICSIMIGAAPVAVATSKRMAADQTEYFGCNGGDKISVISNT